MTYNDDDAAAFRRRRGINKKQDDIVAAMWRQWLVCVCVCLIRMCAYSLLVVSLWLEL